MNLLSKEVIESNQYIQELALLYKCLLVMNGVYCFKITMKTTLRYGRNIAKVMVS